MTNRKSHSSPSSLRRSGKTRYVAPSLRQSGFTIVELLVVVAIIGVLIKLLIPVISKARTASYSAKTQSMIAQISGAIENYYQDFRAYPGPVSNDLLGPTATHGIRLITQTQQLTGSENLVLALSGGLYYDTTGSPANGVTYQASRVGRGPVVLSGVGVKTNQQLQPYVQGIPLSGGHYADGAGAANDTDVPEYIDGYSNPMPILYLRAKSGATTATALTSQTAADNFVCTNGSNVGQYDTNQIIAYTNSTIGEGKNNKLTNTHGLRTPVNVAATIIPTRQSTNTSYVYPYDAYAAFGSPQSEVQTNSSAGQEAWRFNQPRNKDGFILISAGPDRIYGTEDDVNSFGSWAQ